MNAQTIFDYAAGRIIPSYRFHKNYENAMEEVFIKEEYRWLMQGLKEPTIAVDIGAFCGESTLYLAREPKIKKVLAYEPFPFNYNIAKANIAHSQYSSKIILKNAAISNTTNTIRLSQAPQMMTAKAKPIRSGIPVQELQLQSQIAPYRNVIIKCDCEGAEHRIITGDTDLSNVYRMQIEYHYGSQQIPEILRQKGFTVSEQKTMNTLLSGEVGWIFASK